MAPVDPALLDAGGPFGLSLLAAVPGLAAAGCVASAWASVCVTRWAKVGGSGLLLWLRSGAARAGGSGLLLWLRAGAVEEGESVWLALVCTHHLEARCSRLAWGSTASSGCVSG